MLPAGFVYVEDKRIIKSMDYFTSHNFLARPVAGYHAPVCILTKEAAQALIAVQDELDLLNKGYHLKIFDTYRPTQAVEDFIAWSKDFSDIKAKAAFYPDISKPELFEQGYISDRSTHSRGSTVDLTITQIDSKNPQGQDLEMGTNFDFFGELSHTHNPNISELAKENRHFFVTIMEKHGFENFPLEWWHFTLRNEPFPDTYFNFPVE
jgi:D-alanyl-D-alanine dipeptidase